jgi:putative lipoprotein
MIRSSLVAAVVTTLLSCSGISSAQAGSDSASASPMITGTVTYLVRMALQPEAAIDVRLEDVSLADAPAKLVAEYIFAAAGKQVPILFQLPYTAEDIQPNHRYQVRARISVEDKLIFATTQAYPVITNGAPTHVDLVLQPVSGTPATPKPGTGSETTNAATLRGTHWKLTELNGERTVTQEGENGAHLLLDASENRFSGSTGCNRMTGTFVLEGNSLHFGAAATTMMACPEPLMKQEQAVTTALGAVTGYRISGRTLELLAGDKTVARFKAAKPTQSPQ